MAEKDEFISNDSEGFMDPISVSNAYLRMKNLCISLSNEVQADIKIHNQHILPRYHKPNIINFNLLLVSLVKICWNSGIGIYVRDTFAMSFFISF